jgi:threonine dehydratase
MTFVPSVAQVAELRGQLGEMIVETPIHDWHGETVRSRLGEDARLIHKLELLQHTGTFKPRVSLSSLLAMDATERAKGVTAFSAGNHAIGLSYAARLMGCSAKVVMPKTANPARVARCRGYGAEVVLTESIAAAAETVRAIQQEEGRVYVHPFEGERAVLGDATVGLELCRQVSELEAVVVPIGGGGLCAGIAAMVKQLQPGCAVYGVEPEGAASMLRSFRSGKPERLDKVATIADSLGPPASEPLTFELCRKFVDDIVLVSDDDLCRTMALMFSELKLAVEPAGASALSAAFGPLRERLQGKRTGIIVCGTNIDFETYATYLRRGLAVAAPDQAAD